MRRFRKTLFHALAFLSVVLCAGAATLWVRGVRTTDRIILSRLQSTENAKKTSSSLTLMSLDGALAIARSEESSENGTFEARPSWYSHESWQTQPGDYLNFGADLNGWRWGRLIVGHDRNEVGPMKWNIWFVSLPAWLAVALTGVLPVGLGLTRWRRGTRAKTWRSTGRCTSCGYDLRATPDRCPECGAVPARATPAE